MILYGSTISPFVRKAAAFAAEKGIALTLAPGGMGRGGADFAEASPFGKIPALRDPAADDGRDFTLADSTAIVTYLEAKVPEPALIPAAPMARARAVFWEEYADTIFMAPAGKIFFNRFVAPRLGRPADEAVAAAAERDELPPVIDYLERHIPDSGFLVDDRLTLADIAVASPFVNLAHIGVPLDAERWPRTIAYLAAIHARPSFAGLIDADRRQIAAMG